MSIKTLIIPLVLISLSQKSYTMERITKPEVIQIISRGTDKTVSEVKIKNESFALLKFHSKKEFKQELNALARLKHQNIIEMIDCDETSQTITEELADCSLYNFIRNPTCFLEKHYNRSFDNLFLNKIKINLIEQIITAIKFMHTQKRMVNLDIKPQNVVLFFEYKKSLPYIQAKLIDFTSCYEIPDEIDSITLNTFEGTFEYLPPEIISLAPYYKEYNVSFSNDIYSLGLLIYFVINGKCIGRIADKIISLEYEALTEYESQRSFIDLIKFTFL